MFNQASCVLFVLGHAVKPICKPVRSFKSLKQLTKQSRITQLYSFPTQTQSNIGHFLGVAGALSVIMGDTDPNVGVLADEVEDTAHGASHAVLEASAQAHVE